MQKKIVVKVMTAGMTREHELPPDTDKVRYTGLGGEVRPDGSLTIYRYWENSYNVGRTAIAAYAPGVWLEWGGSE